MRADERQAAVAYTYAWWLTGEDDAAEAAVRSALSLPDPGDEGPDAVLVALIGGVRAELESRATMSIGSEVALLHDGLNVPLDAAAAAVGARTDEVGTQLARGRLEALLETVRDDFEHPERLGGLAVQHPPDISHARGCPSCARARTLMERGRIELSQVVSVSSPPGLLRELVSAAEEEPAAAEAPAEAEAPAAPVEDTSPAEAPVAPADGTSTEAPAAPVQAPPVTVREKPAPPLAPTTPAKQKAAVVMAGAGLVTLSVLVAVLVASSGPERPSPTTDLGEEPAVTQPSPEPTGPQTTAPATEAPPSPLGSPAEPREGFAVLDAGLVPPGETDIAGSGTVIGTQDPIRIAVDYEGADEGVTLEAVWRVDDERFEQLQAVVSSISSRHVWGLPVPPDGWPTGAHRIVITADDAVVAATDFTVRDSS